jgi:hypothetical protein
MKSMFTGPSPTALAVGAILVVTAAAPFAQAHQPIDAFLTGQQHREEGAK